MGEIFEILAITGLAAAGGVELLRALTMAALVSRGTTRPAWLRWLWRAVAVLAGGAIGVAAYPWPIGLAGGAGGACSTLALAAVKRWWGEGSPLRDAFQRLPRARDELDGPGHG